VSSINDHHLGGRPLIATERHTGTILNIPKNPKIVTPKPKGQLPSDINRIVQCTKAMALKITITHANIRDQVETFPSSSEEFIAATCLTVNDRNGRVANIKY
jgi:hypothetical protein